MPDMNVNEVVTENEDGSFTIFVNENLCDSKRIEAVNHAFRHIKNWILKRATHKRLNSAHTITKHGNLCAQWTNQRYKPHEVYIYVRSGKRGGNFMSTEETKINQQETSPISTPKNLQVMYSPGHISS